jgi:hypothetical protein
LIPETLSVTNAELPVNVTLMKIVAVTSIFLSVLAGKAAEIPEPALPAGVGVNIHFVTGHEKDLDLIATAGFKFIRMDFGWEGIEKSKGEYDWSGYDQLEANLEKRGLRPVFILDYSHRLYEETVTHQNPVTHQIERTTASPQHPESVAAFARWAAASVRHFQGRHVIWEIWNEPNIQFWSPKPDAQQYATLCLAACKAMREADPAATIIAPASSGFPWDFIETVFKAGALDYLDGVSVHPYREYRFGPETAATDYEKLRQLVERYAPESRKNKIPILSGEWGYATHKKGVSVETQAAFAARQQLANLFAGVPLSIWYDWKNDGTDPDDAEQNFGVVLADLTPKPAYGAIQMLTRELNSYRVSRRLPLESDKDYVLLCANADGKQKLAAWTTADPHSAEVQIRHPFEKALHIIRGTAPGFPRQLEKGRLKLDLTSAPQYADLGVATVKTE